jgi:hypothetical protein
MQRLYHLYPKNPSLRHEVDSKLDFNGTVLRAKCGEELKRVLFGPMHGGRSATREE